MDKYQAEAIVRCAKRGLPTDPQLFREAEECLEGNRVIQQDMFAGIWFPEPLRESPMKGEVYTDNRIMNHDGSLHEIKKPISDVTKKILKNFE
jgi:hypothetical protein